MIKQNSEIEENTCSNTLFFKCNFTLLINPFTPKQIIEACAVHETSTTIHGQKTSQTRLLHYTCTVHVSGQCEVQVERCHLPQPGR